MAPDIQAVKQLLATPQDVVILTHRNPDGDAIGSSLGLQHFLTATGHQVNIVVPSDYPDFLSWLPGANDIVVF
ncbi:MAG: DHH family phosphoesterase, partial [Bacteroidota bacterium]